MYKNFRYIFPLLLFVMSGQSLASGPLPGIEFVSIPAATYQMGTADLLDIQFELPPDNALRIDDEQPAHDVKLDAFEIGKYEITQAQWLAVMETRPGPAKYWSHPQWQQLPVVSVSWHDTQAFITKLNEHDQRYQYRLPTEAEWEYASRGQAISPRPFDADQLGQYAWVLANSGDVPHPVGQLKANAFGVHDIFGNAWEWVSDWYQPDAYLQHAPENPKGPATGELKVRRGGSYHCASHLVRSAYRAADKPSQRYSVLGFRLVRESRKTSLLAH